MKQKVLPPYLAWRGGRPRWVPGPRLRPHFSGRDLKTPAGEWMGLEAAIEAARVLNAEVAAWREGGTGTVRKKARAPKVTRSSRALFDLWQETPEFRMLAPKTRSDYISKAQVFLAAFGDEPVAALGRAALKGFWREIYDSRGHHMANGTLAVARAMLTFACDEEWIDVNPAFALKLKTTAPRVAVWSPPKINAYVAVGDELGTYSVGDAVVVALHSGQRQGDVLTMPPRIFDTKRIALIQHKRGALVDVPMTPALLARVAAIRERWKAANVAARETLITDERTGRPYTGNSFRKAFAAVRAEAVARHPELAEAERFQPALADLRFQDLRDTAVTRLAMVPCTLPQIAAITGHSPDHITSVIKHYLALNGSLADDAIAALTAWLQQQGIAL